VRRRMHFGGRARRKGKTRWPSSRWKNIKMYLGEIGWCGIDWITLTQDRD
jgi:hypothetical protein